MTSKSAKRREIPRTRATARQTAATTSPGQTSKISGNFADFERLFDQLAEAVVITLGQPLPDEKYLPKSRVGTCPAAHNRALLGDRQASGRREEA